MRYILSCLFSLASLSCPAAGLPATKGDVTADVASIAALEKAVSTASPGTLIVLKDGTYDAVCNLTGNGTKEKPVIVKAQSIGGVKLVKQVQMKGQYLSLIGCHFSQKGNISMSGTGLRVSQCTMSDVRTGQWITGSPASRNLEVDHCLFEKKTINKTLSRACQLIRFEVNNKNERHYIHDNHFRDIPKGKTGNGFETIQLITRGNPFDPAPGECGARIENNLFERCNGEAEIISVKSNGNVIRGNVFRACRGSLVFRHGHGNQAIGNFFFGDGEAGSGGIRIQGRNQVIINNYFQDLNLGVAMMDGTTDKLYVRVEDALIAHNSFINCRTALVVGMNHSKHPNGTVPRRCKIINNLFYTTIKSEDEASPIQTVKLVKDDPPEAWTWINNWVHGPLGMSPRPGLQSGDISLRIQPDGLAVPTDKTPAASFPDRQISALKIDIFGTLRPTECTIGAIQFSDKVPSFTGPLSMHNVGPGQ